MNSKAISVDIVIITTAKTRTSIFPEATAISLQRSSSPVHTIPSVVTLLNHAPTDLVIQRREIIVLPCDMREILGNPPELPVCLRFRTVCLLKRMDLKSLMGVKRKVSALFAAISHIPRRLQRELAYKIVDMYGVLGATKIFFST